MALRVGKKYALRRPVTPQRVAAAERRRASIRRTFAVGLTLAFLLITAGAVYTWYVGEQKGDVATVETPKTQQRVEIKPVKRDPNANVGVSVQMLNSPVKAGDNTSVSIRTNPGVSCMVVVTYGATKATDSGLVKKTADDYGIVDWSWTVPAATPAGKGSVKIDCASKTKSGSVTADLLVQV